MTIEEFNSPVWTGGMKARVLNSKIFIGEYDIVSVDFEFRRVVLDVNEFDKSFHHKEIEIILK